MLKAGWQNETTWSLLLHALPSRTQAGKTWRGYQAHRNCARGHQGATRQAHHTLPHLSLLVHLRPQLIDPLHGLPLLALQAQ